MQGVRFEDLRQTSFIFVGEFLCCTGVSAAKVGMMKQSVRFEVDQGSGGSRRSGVQEVRTAKDSEILVQSGVDQGWGVSKDSEVLVQSGVDQI